MTAAAFATWMQGRGLNDTSAAPLLAADRSEVTRWRSGVRAVPRRVARIVELLDELRQERESSHARDLVA